MLRIEIEQKIHFQKEEIETLEQDLQSAREDLISLYDNLEESLREELTDSLAENEKMERRIKFSVDTGNQIL